MGETVYRATLSCPECGHEVEETMPADSCQYFYQCPACGALLRPRAGECCVFCSYGDQLCPPRQRGAEGG
jgi:transcription elongation factor Elf1